MKSLTRGDLQAFHRQWFHPVNFVVAVNGDFDRVVMVQKLDALFADWQFPGYAAPAVPADAQFAAPGVYLVDKEVNQGRVALLLPTSRAAVADFFALQAHGRVPAMLNFTAGAAGVRAACRAAEIRTVVTARRFVERARLEPLLAALGSDIAVVHLEDLRAEIGTVARIRALLRAKLARPRHPAPSPTTSGRWRASSGASSSPGPTRPTRPR